MRNPVTDPARKSEPIFGPQAGHWLAQLVYLTVGLGIFIVFLFVAIYAKQLAQRFIYGEPSRSVPALEPGQSTTVDGVTIKRIN